MSNVTISGTTSTTAYTGFINDTSTTTTTAATTIRTTTSTTHFWNSNLTTLYTTSNDTFENSTTQSPLPQRNEIFLQTMSAQSLAGIFAIFAIILTSIQVRLDHALIMLIIHE